MTKIVINKCYGGFGLSEEAVQAYGKRKGWTIHTHRHNGYMNYHTLVPWEEYDAMDDKDPKKRELWFYGGQVERTDPDLIAVIEELGSEVCSGEYAQLEIVEIPDDVNWTIEEYDGVEWVSEVHRTWS